MEVALDDVVRRVDVSGRPDAPPAAPFFAVQDVFGAVVDALYDEFGKGTYGPKLEEANFVTFATAMQFAFVHAERAERIGEGKEPQPYNLRTLTKRRGDRGYKVSILVEKTKRNKDL